MHVLWRVCVNPYTSEGVHPRALSLSTFSLKLFSESKISSNSSLSILRLNFAQLLKVLIGQHDNVGSGVCLVYDVIIRHR